MKIKIFSATIFWLTTLATFNAYGTSGESIVLDPNTGDYLITYYGIGNPGDKKHKILRQVTFVPATKIEPVVGSIFKLRERGEVIYSYRITNGHNSRQPLAMVIFDPVTDIVSASPLPKRDQDVDLNTIAQINATGAIALTTPENWTGRTTTSRAGGLRIGWSYDSSETIAGLTAGRTQAGFGFSSQAIPGIVMAQLMGDSPISWFADEGPTGEIGDQLHKLKQNNFVPRPAAVPTIAVPNPFDAAALLSRIQAEMHTWIAKQLLDATFSSQLDRYFQSAISAYKLNQPNVGRQQIEAMRALINRELPDLGRDEEHESEKNRERDDEHKAALIARLAARVLDFDLDYVMERMEGHDKEHDAMREEKSSQKGQQKR